MAGTNPYVTPAETTPATKPFKITVLHDDHERIIHVDPADVPYGRTGLPGSLLDVCLGHDVEVEHTCGGVLACSTCHVIVREGLESCNEADDDELDRLEEAPGVTIQSRLACQCVPNGSCDLVVEIPEWNRNAVKEAPH